MIGKIRQVVTRFREDWQAAQDALDRAEQQRQRRQARQSTPSDDTATIAGNDVPPPHGGHCHH